MCLMLRDRLQAFQAWVVGDPALLSESQRGDSNGPAQRPDVVDNSLP